jgi:FMN phosphatase YigB (HAD superfamily)
MFVMPSRRATDVVRALERAAGRVELVSFDVVDTVVARRVAPPEQTKVPAARELARLLARRGVEAALPDVLAARDAAEQELRAATARAGGDGECHLRALCRAWVERFPRSENVAEWAERLHRAEMDGELSVVHPVPGMIEAVRKARALGKRVIFISDMYLGEDDVRRLLDSQGYAGLFDAGYVSSEHGLAKGTGRLFEKVRREQNVPYRRWLHVGDHFFSDWARPRRKGILAHRFVESGTRRRARRLGRLRHLARVSPDWRGAAWFELCRDGGSPATASDLRYAIGFGVLGPLFVNFIHQLLERVAAADARLVMFPAREGFVLRRLFETLREHVIPGHPARSEYVFLTRKATYLASIRELGRREIEMGLWTRRPTLRAMLARFSLDAERFEPFARECRLPLDEPIHEPHAHERFQRFVGHAAVGEQIQACAAARRALLRDYLAQIGFWQAERAALVDVGWHGTTQDALTAAFGDEPQWPRLWGWYAAFLGSKPVVETDRSTYEGVFYHRPRDPIGAAGAALSNFAELFEFAARGPHPTTVGLTRDPRDGGVVPVFADAGSAGPQSERRDRALVTALQAGIFDYADQYARLAPFQDAGAEAYAPFALQTLDRLIRLPRAKEARALLGFHHNEDFGIQTDAPPEPARGAWKTALARAARSPWPEGAVARWGVPGLVKAANLCRVLSGSYR